MTSCSIFPRRWTNADMRQSGSREGCEKEKCCSLHGDYCTLTKGSCCLLDLGKCRLILKADLVRDDELPPIVLNCSWLLHTFARIFFNIGIRGTHRLAFSHFNILNYFIKGKEGVASWLVTWGIRFTKNIGKKLSLIIFFRFQMGNRETTNSKEMEITIKHHTLNRAKIKIMKEQKVLKITPSLDRKEYDRWR